MLQTVALPVWLVIAAGIIVVFAVLDRLLVPSARWFVGSRTNRVLNEVSKRLQVEIRPFQQPGRQALIDRLVYSDGVQDAARQFGEVQGVPREVVMRAEARCSREIVPAFNAYIYFR
ncbi:MAG: glycerol-3-phosphate O-acyltransferase [Rhodospirillaceae bacterium]|nr:MAG: glycerol-3-phosphate O-acyltransferase [Rhodospirillaceae bacterium]